MRINKEQLKKIIYEELDQMAEEVPGSPPNTSGARSQIEKVVKLMFRNKAILPYLEKIKADPILNSQFLAIMATQMGVSPDDLSNQASKIKTQQKTLQSKAPTTPEQGGV
jgi:hypothetical protein